jgi:hypothetical protein
MTLGAVQVVHCIGVVDPATGRVARMRRPEEVLFVEDYRAGLYQVPKLHLPSHYTKLVGFWRGEPK